MLAPTFERARVPFLLTVLGIYLRGGWGAGEGAGARGERKRGGERMVGRERKGRWGRGGRGGEGVERGTEKGERKEGGEGGLGEGGLGEGRWGM